MTHGERPQSMAHRPRRGRLSRRAAAIVAATLAAGLLLSGCSSGAGPQERTAGDTLTVATVTTPKTLDPAKTLQRDHWFVQLAYEPLIVRRSDGSLQPGLATSWSYEGTGNTTFVLNLREGVTFADGSSLTAQGVVDYFEYLVEAGGQAAASFAGNTFTATGPLTVTITAAQPNPDFPQLLTQDRAGSGVPSEKGLQEPSLMGTQTFGAGPYMLDPAQTVNGNHYTYVPNPNYYDESRIHWEKVVIRSLPNPQSVLNALRTGQAQVALGDPATVGAATQAGLTVASAPFLWNGVVLADRDGTLCEALSDVRVRQALNYATDRAAIANALFDGAGTPTHQITVEGGYGYDPALNNRYPYDLGKARDLLAEAGYANGFELAIVTPEIQQQNLVAQALAQQWKEIGVELKITSYADTNQYTSDAFAAKFPAFTTAFGQLPLWIEGPVLYLPRAAFNPFHTTDATLQGLYDEKAQSSGDDAESFDQPIVRYLTEQAWFVPVVATGLPFYATTSVTGVSTSPKAPLLTLYEIRPAE